MRKLTRTEANFENLLEAALLVEGHCSHAAHGCNCRGCDECEENYMMESEEGKKESLADLIGKYVEGKPNTDVPYGDDPRADDEEYDEEAEDLKFNSINAALELVSRMPEGKYLSLNAATRRMAGARDKIAKGVESVANKFAKDAAAMAST
jgi:hypothetical protein